MYQTCITDLDLKHRPRTEVDIVNIVPDSNAVLSATFVTVLDNSNNYVLIGLFVFLHLVCIEIVA